MLKIWSSRKLYKYFLLNPHCPEYKLIRKVSVLLFKMITTWDLLICINSFTSFQHPSSRSVSWHNTCSQLNVVIHTSNVPVNPVTCKYVILLNSIWRQVKIYIECKGKILYCEHGMYEIFQNILLYIK